MVDSGASCEVKPYPPEWNGVPPPGGMPIQLEIAVGSVGAYLINRVAYIDVDKYGGGDVFEALFPWGRGCKLCDLTVDSNYGSDENYVMHKPSGYRAPVCGRERVPTSTSGTSRS